MLRIRLSRVGKKKQPSYRMVVADSHSPRDGAFLKIIGHYNPLAEPAVLVVKEEEAVYWLQKGAQPSETAAKLLTRIGVMERAGRQPVVYTPKEGGVKPKKQAEAAAPVAPAAPAAAAAPPAAATAAPAAEATAEVAAEAPAAETPVEAAAEAAPEAPAAEAPAEAPTEAPEPAAEPDAEPPAEAETQDDSEPTE